MQGYQGDPMSKSCGWQQSGDLAPNASANSVPLQAGFPRADVYTVQFNVAYPKGLPFLSPPERYIPIFVEALVTWSVAGGTVQRRVSVANGTSISGVGEACTVAIVDRSPQVGQGVYTVGNHYVAYPPTVTYTVQATIAPGNRASNSVGPVLTRWEWSNQLTEPANTFEASIPADCGAISTFVSTDPPANVKVQQVFANPSSQPTNLFNYTPEEDTIQFVPIMPSVTEIQVENSTGTAYSVTLFLGIDG